MTREGNPIRKRRYFFSETFAAISLAAYAKATNDESMAKKARDIFGTCLEYADGVRNMEKKFEDPTNQRNWNSDDYD